MFLAASPPAPRSSGRSRFRLARLWFCALMLCCVSCRVDGTVIVTVDDDLTGTVVVRLELDEAALDALGDIDALEFADAEEAGWDVLIQPTDPGGDPAGAGADGTVLVLAAQKSFSGSDELGVAMAEIGGDPLVFDGWNVESVGRFSGDDVTIDGSIELTGSIEQFGDDALAESLDGFRAGVPPLLAEEDSLSLRVNVRRESGEWDAVSGLDGSASTAEATYPIGKGEQVASSVVASASSRRVAPIALIVAGGAMVLVAGLVMVLTRSRPDE